MDQDATALADSDSWGLDHQSLWVKLEEAWLVARSSEVQLVAAEHLVSMNAAVASRMLVQRAERVPWRPLYPLVE